MTVSVIIPTLNRSDLLERCMKSLETYAPDARVVIVGQEQPRTFAENCNIGAARIDGDVLLFLNDDTEVREDAVYAMACVLEARPEVGIVGARLTYPIDVDGPKMLDKLGLRVQHAGVYLTLENGCVMGHHYQDARPSGPVTAVTGAALMIRRELFDGLGGFDEAYRNGNEDVDLCLRAIQAGATVWYERDAIISHHESASGDARWTYVRENIELLARRWYPVLSK